MSNETEFLEKAQAAFAASVRQLDAGATARLREARIAALNQAGSRPALWRSRWALPAGAAALAGAIIVAGFIWLNFNTHAPSVPFAAHSNEDMAIELSGDNLDMYADMDFYRWLQVQQDAAPAASASGGDSNG